MSGAASFVVHAGARAAAHLRAHGLAPHDIACIPAAAGGPKGLALVPLDKWLFGHWLRQTPRLELIGASIGAWRLYACAQADAVAALDRLAESYLAQHFPPQPTPAQVAAQMRRFVRAVIGDGGTHTLRQHIALSVLTARARGALHGRNCRAAFARAAASNVWSRAALARYFQRIIFTAHDAHFPSRVFDAFGLQRVPLTADNLEDALLASGSIPLLCEPVRNPRGAPTGDYWDGGLIDYHLLLPYRELPGLVLYPHFAPYVTPGWLDKFLPWRARPHAHPWLENVLLISPSPSLLQRLPNRKLPDRKDFYRYGHDDERRQRDDKSPHQPTRSDDHCISLASLVA
ncbi:MAG: patatin-like phospholipase family protein, partial [Burkholderiaceae bacterium]|nr:patatin-like phospholipase family protein [Burkholderiaceae bacterium]